MVLRHAGLYCEEAADGVLALEALHARPFDLVILDIDMPNMKGTEVLDRLRENPPCSHLKIIMISGRATSDELANMMLAGADDYLVKPFTSTQIRARVQTALNLKDTQDQSDHRQYNLLGANKELVHILRPRQRTHARQECHGPRPGRSGGLSRSRNRRPPAPLAALQPALAETAVAFPEFAGALDTAFIERLESCVPLHDIGKAGIPDHILMKPGKLTDDEFEVMKTHTTIGADILNKVAAKHDFDRSFLKMAMEITRHHHERFDGTGYPDGLAGSTIPLSARIVAIADVYDALRSRRVYKPAFPHADVVKIMAQQSPGHFDPALLKVFEQCAHQFETLFDEVTP